MNDHSDLKPEGRDLRPETLALHAGWRADPTTGSVAPPIYQTTSFQFVDARQAAARFALEEIGNIYTRLGNPTNDILERRIAALDGAAGAVAVASGQAASTIAIQTLARAGDNIVSGTDLYGGTYNLFANTLGNMGIETRFVDPSDPDAFARAVDDNTRAFYVETLPNPKLIVCPIAEIAEVGRRLGIPLIVDNTAAPLIARPADHGAACIVYSTTKFIGGHGTSIGGIIVDCGTFDWTTHPGRTPLLTTADPSYHGLVWTDAAKTLGPIALTLRARAVLLRDTGAALSPFNAFQIIQGLETLPLRMQRHCENAAAVAVHLSGHPSVTKVIYPSLQTGSAGERARRYLRSGFGGLLGIELAGGVEAAERFIAALRLFYHVANIGDTRSLAIHPATTTHSQLTKDERLAAGVTDGYVRLSIGIEHIDDICEDLDQAIAASTRS